MANPLKLHWQIILQRQENTHNKICFSIQVYWSEVRLKFQEYRTNKSGFELDGNKFHFLYLLFGFSFVVIDYPQQRSYYWGGGGMRLIMSINLYEINLLGRWVENAQKEMDIARDGKMCGYCGYICAIFSLGCANFSAVYAQTG